MVAVVARPPLNWSKIIFWQTIVILCLQTNLTQWFKLSFVQNTAHKVFWRGYSTLSEYKLREMVRKRWAVTCREITPTLTLISRMGNGSENNSLFVVWRKAISEKEFQCYYGIFDFIKLLQQTRGSQYWIFELLKFVIGIFHVASFRLI